MYFGWGIANPWNLVLGFRDFLGFALRKEPKLLKLKVWLGGLDSNQDSQIQSLESYQLDDLPTEGKAAGSSSGKKKWMRNRTPTFLE